MDNDFYTQNRDYQQSRKEHSYENERYFQILLDVDDDRIDLNSWEVDFVERLLTYFPDRLTEKQINVIKKIAFKYLGEVI